VQVLNAVNPPGNLLWLLVGRFDGVDVHGGCADNILALDVFKLEHSLVFVVKSRFVQHSNTQVFLGTVGLRHLHKGIDFADCGDVVRDERLDLGVQVDLLRLVAANILEDLSNLL